MSDPIKHPPFRDFIPEGEDPGAQGAGFRDFVPAKEEVVEEIEKPVKKKRA